MLLKVEHITKSIGKRCILQDLSFDLQAGELCGIVGENGAGKSTLLKIIVGEWQAGHGHVSVYGKLGYCPQKCILIPQLTVYEHFQYFAAAYSMHHDECLKRSEYLMDIFNFRSYRDEPVNKISGGTQQKLNLSIALLNNPNLLILDEPYSGFDWETYTRFWAFTEELKNKGCALLIVSHLLTEKEKFDNIFTLEKGSFV
jgi:ABC-type multidrug transport system ATPase subunit